MKTNNAFRIALVPVAILTAGLVAVGLSAQERNTAPNTAEPAPIVLAQAAPAERQFELGTHFERLSPTQPTSSGPDQIEVAEVFWYACPHCYTFDPYLEGWKEDLAADVSFVRIPALWNELLQLHGRIYYTAEALGKLDEMHADIFREIHVNRNGLNNPTLIRDLFGNYGVDATTFDQTFESFAVYTKIQRADELARRYRVASVPTVIVNGKYTTNATMAGSYPNLIAVINQLIEMERAGE